MYLDLTKSRSRKGRDSCCSTAPLLFDSSCGRFPQADPMGYDDGTNLYGYVGSDPINYVDPTGTEQLCWNEDNTYTTSDGTIVVGTKQVCGNFDSGTGVGEPGWSIGGGIQGFPTPECHFPMNCPNPQPLTPQPAEEPRCPTQPLAPTERTYPVPEGYTALGEADPRNLFVNDPQGKMAINPLYQQAMDDAGGVDIRGVFVDLGKTAFGVGLSVAGGPIGSAHYAIDVKDVARAASLVGTSAAKTVGSPAVRCRR